MIPKTIIHLLSGGLDSTVMLYDLVGQNQLVHALLFHYRQKHAQELEFAKLHCRKLGVLFTVVDLPQLKGSTLTDGKGGTIVPNRNAIFLSVAASIAADAKAECVTYACNSGDAEDYPDCRPAFVKALNAALKAAEVGVEICAPFIGKTKREIAQIGISIGVPLEQTWSCYMGGQKPCGKCSACRKRQAALK